MKPEFVVSSAFGHDSEMRGIVILLTRVLVTLVQFTRPGGVRSVIAESELVKHKLLILDPSRQRSPNLRVSDRIPVGLFAGFDGSVHAPHRPIWHSSWSCRWVGIVSDVHSSGSTETFAEASPHRQ